MRHLPHSECPRYVSDRLSAVSNVPMQFLASAGLVATILVIVSLADLMPKRRAAAGVDAQTVSGGSRDASQTPRLSVHVIRSPV